MRDRLLRVGAVVAIGVLLGWSGWIQFRALPPAKVSSVEARDVARGAAILQRSNKPIRSLILCSPVVGLAPDRVSGQAMVDHLSDKAKGDALICFRGGFDFPDAEALAIRRGWTWSADLGGGKLVAYAKDEAGFRRAAEADGLALRPGELVPHVLARDLHAQPGRAERIGEAWLIHADPQGSQDLFGPYLLVGQGPHEVEATLAPAAKNADCAAFAASTKLWLSATANLGQRLLADKQPVALTREAGPDCRLQAQWRFTVPPGPPLGIETPLWLAAPGDVWLTGYDIQTPAAEPIKPAA